MDNDELSTLIHALNEVSQRRLSEIGRHYRSQIAQVERYADAMERAMVSFLAIEASAPAELVLPMTDDEARKLYAESARIAERIRQAKDLHRRETMHVRRPKYDPPDDCPF